MAYTLNPYATLPYGMGTQFEPHSSMGVVNFSTGSIVMDSTTPIAVEVELGFAPRKVRIVDVTALATWEYMDMFPANTTLKTTFASGAPTSTLDTTGLITISDNNGVTQVEGDYKGFLVAATALTASHTYVFEAFA